MKLTKLFIMVHIKFTLNFNYRKDKMDKFRNDIEYNQASKLAIAKMVDTIHSLSKLDNCQTNYISTKRFIETDTIPEMTKHDYNVINNLKSSLNLIINNNDIIKLDINSLRDINKRIGINLIQNNGFFRSSDVYISGLSRQHIVPPASEVLFADELDNILYNDGELSGKNIVKAGAYIIKSQPFTDGNKRTAFVFMNLALIKADIGIVNLQENIIYNEFQECLEELFINNDDTKFNDLVSANIQPIDKLDNVVELKKAKSKLNL